MKRLWIGVGLLVIFLALGIFTTVTMARIHDPISEKLKQAEEAALDQDWPHAASLAREARGQWLRHRNVTASLADHSPMEEIDGLFDELDVYLQEKELVHFAACCAQLSARVQAIGEAHSISWWNLL